MINVKNLNVNVNVKNLDKTLDLVSTPSFSFLGLVKVPALVLDAPVEYLIEYNNWSVQLYTTSECYLHSL